MHKTNYCCLSLSLSLFSPPFLSLPSLSHQNPETSRGDQRNLSPSHSRTQTHSQQHTNMDDDKGVSLTFAPSSGSKILANDSDFTRIDEFVAARLNTSENCVKTSAIPEAELNRLIHNACACMYMYMYM